MKIKQPDITEYLYSYQARKTTNLLLLRIFMRTTPLFIRRELYSR